MDLFSLNKNNSNFRTWIEIKRKLRNLFCSKSMSYLALLNTQQVCSIMQTELPIQLISKISRSSEAQTSKHTEVWNTQPFC